MQTLSNLEIFVPQFVPQKMNGKLSYRICIKKDHVRTDKTCALYLSIYYLGKRKRINLNISVPIKSFDAATQRVKKNYKYSNEYNLLIEKALGDLNTIEVNYRLNNETITLDKVVEDFLNPSVRVNYNAFAKKLLDYQLKEKIIMHSTYLQQNGFIEKLKRWKDPIPFNEIDKDFLKKLEVYLTKSLKNKPATVQSTLKNFKKYLHEANNRGIKTKLNYTDISIGPMKGDFTFLMPSELNRLLEFYNNPFINYSWKCILQRYLFSCFTGLRISDIEAITSENLIDGMLVFKSHKSGKFQKIKLNDTAKGLIELPHVFNGKAFTRQHINKELKLIAKACGIKKRVYFHSARHTFATNFLIAGGQIQNLQQLLGHSTIETTMVYVHAAESIQNEEIKLMDNLIKTSQR